MNGNRLFDDLARVTEGAVSTVVGVRREIESLVRQQVERMLSGLDLVTREEFETVREMAVRARTEQERLEQRIDALEAALAARPRPRRRRRPESES